MDHGPVLGTRALSSSQSPEQLPEPRAAPRESPEQHPERAQSSTQSPQQLPEARQGRAGGGSAGQSWLWGQGPLSAPCQCPLGAAAPPVNDLCTGTSLPAAEQPGPALLWGFRGHPGTVPTAAGSTPVQVQPPRGTSAPAVPADRDCPGHGSCRVWVQRWE